MPHSFPLTVTIEWHEKGKKRDIDNVESSIKYILDSFVKAGVLPDDGQKYIKQIRHDFHNDSDYFQIIKFVEKGDKNEGI